MEADDLGRGRALAQSGRLGAIVVLEGMASAVVDPGSSNPLMAQVKVDRLDVKAWTTFAREATRESGNVAALEAGELPIDLVEHADEAGVELIPGPGDIESACECEASAQPCVHSLALLYQLAWQVDSDPYVLMLLRGRTREDLLAEVAALASGYPRPVRRSARRCASAQRRSSRSPRTRPAVTGSPTLPWRRTTRRSVGCSDARLEPVEDQVEPEQELVPKS